MKTDRSEFYKGVLTLFAAGGAILSGYLIVGSIGWSSLIVFSTKSFLLGSAIGAVTIAKKRIITGRQREGGRVIEEYEEVNDPSGVWFIVGFGSVIAVGAFFLVVELLALTTLFVFSSGFMFVYSGAAKELIGAREFVRFLSYVIISITIFWASFSFFAWALPPIWEFLPFINP